MYLSSSKNSKNDLSLEAYCWCMISWCTSDTSASFLCAAMTWISQPTVVMHIETWSFLGCYIKPRHLYQLMKLNSNSTVQTYIFLNTHHNILFREF